jgi:diguanylate cyclase
LYAKALTNNGSCFNKPNFNNEQIMDKQASPIEIARQTLMQLTTRKIPPTPDNFRRVYDEIAGKKSVDQSQALAKTLDKVLHDLGKKTPKYIIAAQAIAPLIEKKDWTKVEEQFRKLLPSSSGDSTEVNWSILIRNLLKQLETSHKGVTLSRKKEGLGRVLTNFANDPEQMGQKIIALMASWGEGGDAIATADDASARVVLNQVSATGYVEVAGTPSNENAALSQHWRDMLIRTFELILVPHLAAVPEAQNKAQQLLEQMRQAKTEQAILRCGNDLRNVLIALEMQYDQQSRIHESLLQLLRLMISSMGELAIEDAWLQGQTTVLQEIVSKPLNLNMLYDAESSIKQLVYKQSQLKPVMLEAKDTIKMMASTFIDRMVELTESTSDYHQKIEEYQQKISNTEDIGELSQILKGILDDTRAVGLNLQRTRDEFNISQRKAAEAELRIMELTAELEKISEVAHQDYLTGALNRRGMDEALEREFNRADRYKTTLSVAMMDIDHFKKLNDSLGHATGDQALSHFAKVIKDVMRTTDVLARYGGEEFVIILPATPQDEAINVVTRVQRELTKNFFLYRNERVLITFSAGVAERKDQETPQSLIPRADAALYQAKNSGRNQVIGAELGVGDKAESGEL